MSPEMAVVDQEFLGQQRDRLEEEREVQAQVVESLASEVNGLSRGRESGGAHEEGFGTGETASVDLQRARGEHRRAVAHLEEIDRALARIDAGTYGLCEVCGQPIGAPRLTALPTATRCIRCQAARRAS